jgi:BolA protein
MTVGAARGDFATTGMPGGLMSAESRIRERLMVALEPIRLDVVNESHLHAGHRSSPGTGESHFRVLVVSQAFQGRSRIERHRMVNEALAEELKGKLHALAIKAYAPGEAVA